MPGDPLTPRVLDWVRRCLGHGVEIISTRKMAGSTSSDLYALELKEGSLTYTLVLRLFTNQTWLEEEPDLAEHESAALELAAKTGLPVPTIVTKDADGSACGFQTVLMTQVSGAVNLQHADFEDWLRQMAAALAPLHSLDAEDFKWHYYSYNKPNEVQVPSWTSKPRDWERAIELVNQPAPESQISFIHRDYHPMNTLWQTGRLSGIVDWVNACRGPSSFDAAWMRINLMQMYGMQAADRFLDHYLDLCGEKAYHPYWDLMALIELLPGPPYVYEPWPVFGLKGLSSSLLIQRADDYLACVLKRV